MLWIQRTMATRRRARMSTHLVTDRFAAGHGLSRQLSGWCVSVQRARTSGRLGFADAGIAGLVLVMDLSGTMLPALAAGEARKLRS